MVEHLPTNRKARKKEKKEVPSLNKEQKETTKDESALEGRGRT